MCQKCIRCGVTKELDQFHKAYVLKNGFQIYRKECSACKNMAGRTQYKEGRITRKNKQNPKVIEENDTAEISCEPLNLAMAYKKQVDFERSLEERFGV